jgi:hypothetical protein
MTKKNCIGTKSTFKAGNIEIHAWVRKERACKESKLAFVRIVIFLSFLCQCGSVVTKDN